MFIAPSEHSIFFDIDDTIIMWSDTFRLPFDGAVKIVCPHDGQVSYHRPHKRHIEFLKKQKAKGMTVVVWSAGGVGWAAEVVRTLGLEEYVDIVVSKPDKYVDDLVNPAQILGTRLYLEESGSSI